jgi:hypothetical protein
MSKNISLHIYSLANNKYFVGESVDPTLEWTIINPVNHIVKTTQNVLKTEIDKHVKAWMCIYGILNVRGGSYTDTVLDKNVYDSLYSEFKKICTECGKCGGNDHYIEDCSDTQMIRSRLSNNVYNKKYNKKELIKLKNDVWIILDKANTFFTNLGKYFYIQQLHIFDSYVVYLQAQLMKVNALKKSNTINNRTNPKNNSSLKILELHESYLKLLITISDNIINKKHAFAVSIFYDILIDWLIDSNNELLVADNLLFQPPDVYNWIVQFPLSTI